MSDERELLLDTFDAHQHLVPDEFDVLTRANEIARTRRRVRWVVQATSASLVTAGLVAGGIALPGVFSGGTSEDHSATVIPADGGGTTTATKQDEYAAFFNAGYEYADAQQLADLWHETDTNKVKAEAGQKLLDGDTLPIPPSGEPAPPEDLAVTAFFNAGYDYNDAVTLAGMWNESTSQAKIDAGKKIENGETLPIQPSGNSDSTNPAAISSKAKGKRLVLARAHLAQKKAGIIAASGAPAGSSDTAESPALAAYFNAGYDYADAQQLASLWHESDINQVKSEAGQKLLDGDTLPIPPSGDPAAPPNQAVEAFFNAGYDYNDAVKLGKMWNVSTYHAKVEAGKKIENGQALPIQP
jgi:hypothetical protein